MSPEMRDSIDKTLKDLKIDPYPHGRKKLRGTVNSWRIQIGRYRVLYDLDAARQTITLLKIGRRREDTYRFL